MGTPEKGKNSQIATPVSKFEDSPVFNFLNNLSPIKQVKSTHISQSINPLTFASLPSVFTSPHVSSLAESRFLRRHQLSDPSKPDFSSDDTSIFDKSTINMDGKENLDPRASNSELAHEPSYECSKVVIPSVENMGDYACNSSTLVPFVNEASQRDLFRNEMNPEGIISQIDQNNEATSCDWDSLIANSEFLVFESPNDGESYNKKPVDPATSFYTSIKNAMQNMQSLGEGSKLEDMSTQLGDGSEIMENEHHLSGSFRGMKGRRLVFEMGGAHRKHLQESAKSDSFVLLQPDNNTIVNQQLAPKKAGKLPGIGLHLNALAATPKDYKIVNHEASSSGRLIIGPSPSANFNHHPASSQELLTNALVVSSLDREIDSVENGELLVDDVCQEIGYMANDEINQSSPKKKRRKEQAGEGESCKRCNCKKSKCLKLYCECFAAGVYCVEPCACIDCFNKPVHEDTVLATRKQIESRNPLAFAPKVIRGSDSPSEMGEDSSKTPASARHKRGCNCKKSGCLKKYCECYQGGVGCSINCRCEGCRNVFGRKDGCGAIGNEVEFEEDETNTVGKTLLDRTFHKTGTHNDIEQNMVSAPPATPTRAGRQLTQPFSSKKKPPRSTFPSISTSSSSQSNFLQPRPKFDKHFKNVLEDEMPEFLQSVSPIKSSSPNGKRVFSSPQGVEKSPGLRSSRKLILRSIPSFPSLTNNQ